MVYEGHFSLRILTAGKKIIAYDAQSKYLEAAKLMIKAFHIFINIVKIRGIKKAAEEAAALKEGYIFIFCKLLQSRYSIQAFVSAVRVPGCLAYYS